MTRIGISAKIASFDAYVFVTPEYSRATSGALKNAIDFLYHEWVNKEAGFVGYGGGSATRAVENLRHASSRRPASVWSAVFPHLSNSKHSFTA